MGRAGSITAGVLASLVGAGCASTPPAGGDPIAGDPTSEKPEPHGPRAAGAPYEVHEWGLVRADVGDVLNTGVIAPPSYEPMIMDKPVLYFHPQRAMELRSVRVRTPNGSVLETWPAAEATSEADILWTGVSLVPGPGCMVSPLPNRGEPPCSTLPPDMECETPGLSIVRTEDAACVSAHGMNERFLFYRARTEKFTPPLRFERAEDHVNVTVVNDSDTVIPGMLVRIRNDDGVVRSSMVLPPAPRKSLVVGVDSVTDGKSVDELGISDRRAAPASGAGPDAVRMTMTELGMTPFEIDAFMGAWSEALFMPAGFNGLRSPSDAFLYFLPASTIDGIAKLDFDPPPRAVKRAFAVWSAVDSFVPRRY